MFIQNYFAHTAVTAAVASAAGTVVAGEVPQQPAAFQPRTGLLEELRAGGPGVSVVRAVTGMRGVGKTQVAAAYARSCVDAGWRLVAWVNARDTAQVLNGLAVASARLGIGTQDADLEATAGVVRNWLEADGERCLVVFDDVADLDRLRPFLPAAGRAQVVITNTGQWSGLGRVVPVDVFTEAEALTFLAQRTRRDDDSEARELARELGYLPLALAQAAAVIAGQHLSYPVYLERLRSLPVREYLTPARGEPYPHGVAQAVLLSLDAVAAADETGLCKAILDTVSLLSAAGVPRSLLYAAAEAGVFSLPGASSSAAEPRELDAAIGLLAGGALLAFSGDDSSVIAHRLVMRVVREHLAHDGTLDALGSGVCALLRIVSLSLGEPWQTRAAARDAVQQVSALYEHWAPHLHDDHPACAGGLLDLRRWALGCMNALGDSFTQAIEYGEPLVRDCARLLGDVHPDTLHARGNLAAAYDKAGRSAEAIPLMERTLADQEQVLGDTHPGTLTTRDNLASAYDSVGRSAEAIALHKRTIADQEQVRGDTHPDTLRSRSNLAHAYQAVGQLDKAIPLMERTLADREQVLGVAHPDTLLSRNNLAQAYKAAGQLGKAIPILERTLTESERLLGDTHPRTLNSHNNLAIAYQAAGQLGKAIPILERTLTDCERLLGDTHPDTLGSRNNLAYAHRAAGRLDKAIALYEQTLADSEQVLGVTHPDTLGYRNNLAYTYQEAGRLGKAIALYQRTLADSERELGDIHPHTHSVRNNLAYAYREAGRLAEAIPILERALADSERELGDTHPNTVLFRKNLAVVYEEAARSEKDGVGT